MVQNYPEAAVYVVVHFVAILHFFQKEMWDLIYKKMVWDLHLKYYVLNC